MIGSRLFIDTPPLIYLIEKNPAYFNPVSLFFADSIQNNRVLITSVLTASEFGVKPWRLNRLDLLQEFEKTVKRLFEVSAITWDVAEISSILRAKYTSLQGYRFTANSLCIKKQLHHLRYERQKT